MKRQSLLALAMVALVALAGCSATPGGNGGEAGTGTMTVYLSDQPSAIEDFEHLNVTVSSVGFHKVNASGVGNESSEWVQKNVSGTDDLTALTGQNATNLTRLGLPNGTYNKVFVHVSAVNGTLTDGTHPDVKLPSNKLHVQTNFTIGSGEQAHFVFDPAVHETGNGRYTVKPNAGESGPDQPIKKVTQGNQTDETQTTTTTSGNASA